MKQSYDKTFGGQSAGWFKPWVPHYSEGMELLDRFDCDVTWSASETIEAACIRFLAKLNLRQFQKLRNRVKRDPHSRLIATRRVLEKLCFPVRRTKRGSTLLSAKETYESLAVRINKKRLEELANKFRLRAD
jgi:hypothetical protein